MYSLCDHCGNTGCVLQSGIPRVSCAGYIQVVTLKDYIRTTVDEEFKKKEQESKKDEQFVWVVTYKNVCDDLCVVVFDKYEEARKFRNDAREFDSGASLLERVVYGKYVKAKENKE